MAKNKVKEPKTSQKTEKKPPARRTEKNSAAAKKPAKIDPKKPVKKSAAAAKKPPAKSAKSKVRKKAHVTRPTPEEERLIAERRRDVWELKKSGASIRAIQDVFRNRGQEISTGTIFNDLQAEIRHIQSETLDLCEEYRTLTNDRMEDGILAMFGIIKSIKSTAFEKTEAVKQLNNCVKTQIEIGMIPRAAKKLEINSRSELAKLLGVAEEELPDDLGAD